MSADWKKKYMDLRSQMLEIKDVAFRLGYETGMKDSQMQQMQQQVQDAQAQAAAMQGQQVDPETGEVIQDPNAQSDQEMMGDEMPMDEGQGSELDQHIGELENLVSKGSKPSVIDMRKAVEAIATLRKSQKDKVKNRTPEIVSEQKKLVNKILDKWSKESESVTSNIDKLIEKEGLNIEIK